MNWPTIDYMSRPAPVLAITAPPCPACRHWVPQIDYRATHTGYEPNGLVCCHAEQMHYDFSCFKPKDAA